MRLYALLVTLLITPLAFCAKQDDVKATALSVSENRDIVLSEMGEQSTRPLPVSLTRVVTSLDSLDPERVSGLGWLRLVRAVDEQGRQLVPIPADQARASTSPPGYPVYPSTFPLFFGYLSLRDERLRNLQAQHGAGRKRVVVPIDLPRVPAIPRASRKIETLKAEVCILRGTSEKVVTVKHVKDAWGKELQDPALKEAGLVIRLLTAAELKARRGEAAPVVGAVTDWKLAIEVQGRRNAFGTVEVVKPGPDKDDIVPVPDVTMGFSLQEGAKSSTIVYYLDRPLPGTDEAKRLKDYVQKSAPHSAGPYEDDTGLRFRVYSGGEIKTLTFELKDVPLP